MKVVQINSVCAQGSTGKICVGISKVLNEKDIENYILYYTGKSDYKNSIKCADSFPKFQALKSRILGNYGFNSPIATRKIISEIEKISPDIVHLHNLHSHNCNLEKLFDYFRKKRIKLIWTFHDCWAFTAYCPHFTMAKCDKWKVNCNNCVQSKTFSWFFDRSSWLHKKKKEAFKGLELTIVTPSQWLADITKESFFKNYPIKVINNGIDLEIFKFRESEFRKKYNIADNKFIILGVAIKWIPRKGADVLINLANKLDQSKYQIIMVGTDDEIDKELPDSIISIHRTQNQIELAEIYSAADLFVNPTREEVFGLVNVEALACGTPVITFNTGGSPECIDEKSGIVVNCNDEEALYNSILRIELEKPFSKEDCVNRAKKFNEKDKCNEYAHLYKSIM